MRRSGVCHCIDVRWYFPDEVDSIEDSNVAHIAEHGLTPEDFEHALNNPVSSEDISESSDRRAKFGYACDGCLIAVVYEWIDEFTILPVTAFEPQEWK